MYKIFSKKVIVKFALIYFLARLCFISHFSWCHYCLYLIYCHHDTIKRYDYTRALVICLAYLLCIVRLFTHIRTCGERKYIFLYCKISGRSLNISTYVVRWRRLHRQWQQLLHGYRLHIVISPYPQRQASCIAYICTYVLFWDAEFCVWLHNNMYMLREWSETKKNGRNLINSFNDLVGKIFLSFNFTFFI